MQLAHADHAEYELIAAVLRATVAAYPPALRRLAAPALDRLLAGEFSQLAALLPRWLGDLAPVAAPIQRALGTAGLWLWWYADVLDGLIDGALPPGELPAAQQALLRALAIYRGLGLADTPAWADLEARALAAADAYARELGSRVPLADLNAAQLAAWEPTLLMDRAGPFAFSGTAMLVLAGLPEGAPLRADLERALRCLSGARQIADDASDWLEDLRAGQLNAVSAALIRHFLTTNAPSGRADLSLDRLAGYQLAHEEFWEEIKATHAALCAEALTHLAPYGPSRLAELVRRQQASDDAGWQRLGVQRAGLRELFGAQAR